MIDTAPRYICNVEKTVDTTEVDERTVIGNILNNSLHDNSLLENLKGCCSKLITLTEKNCTTRENDVPLVTSNLENLEIEVLS